MLQRVLAVTVVLLGPPYFLGADPPEGPPAAERRRGGSAEFYANQVFYTLEVKSVEEPERVHDGWRWTAIVSTSERELTVSPSPSRLRAVSVRAPGAALPVSRSTGCRCVERKACSTGLDPNRFPKERNFGSDWRAPPRHPRDNVAPGLEVDDAVSNSGCRTSRGKAGRR